MYAGTILRSGEHLLALINQVLDLSKIEAGRMTLKIEETDLFRLLDDLQEMFALKAEQKGVSLAIVHAAEAPRVIRTDEVKLRQILINLLSNAIKFTERGEVTLNVRSKGFSPVRREGFSLQKALKSWRRTCNFQFPIPAPVLRRRNSMAYSKPSPKPLPDASLRRGQDWDWRSAANTPGSWGATFASAVNPDAVRPLQLN